MSDQILQFHKKSNYGRISKDKVVTLRYAVSDTDSQETLEFRDDLIYLHGGYGGAFPKMEEALEGMAVDESVSLDLKAEEAFGPRVLELVVTAPTEHFPPEAGTVGTQIQGEAPDGHVLQFRVVEVKDGLITVDGNHPFAGRNLSFVLEVLNIREATAEELQAGHAFRPTPS